ncbi:hypothetical protein [Clostridium estertheticum]|uniref:hypothetical protein n=1 Tax=Clostridium estertheticum TaxID=238834 RepID=UPI00271467FD|nr:hypothetical protein [Clostridium estertheticum]
MDGIILKLTLYNCKNCIGDLCSSFNNKKEQIVDNNNPKENPISSLNPIISCKKNINIRDIKNEKKYLNKFIIHAIIDLKEIIYNTSYFKSSKDRNDILCYIIGISKRSILNKYMTLFCTLH